MKRTKNYFDKPQPHHLQREAISGCIRFDGEDLGIPLLIPQSIYLLKRFRSSLNTFQKPPEGVVKIINGWKVWEKTQRKGGITLLCLANFRIKSYEVMFSSAFLLIKLEGCLLMIFNKGRPILNVMLKTLTWIYHNHKRISAKITRIISLPMSNPWLKGLISMELNSNIRCQTHWWTCLNFDISI